MRWSYNRRSTLHRLFQAFTAVVLICSILDVLLARHAAGKQHAQDNSYVLGSESVYIAAIHWNNEAILKSHWIPALLEFVREIGSQRVFVSIYESGSWDGTKAVLAGLDIELGKADIRRKIVLDPSTHREEVNQPPAEKGWIMTPRHRMELRRIPYLARLRNLVLEPLFELEKGGETFDKVLFLNDVVFTSKDVRNLLSTRGGDYAAACSLDFSEPPKFYDTFALRDSEGHEAVMQTWPFFRARESRSAMKANRAVPVSSCWNGMVAIDPTPFYERNISFRGIPDSLASRHLEASECCLIHTDNSLSSTKGVWLNPMVRVGFDGPAYDAVNPNTTWLSIWEVVKGSWSNRFRRWFMTVYFKEIVVRWRISAWRKEFPEVDEKGVDCVINEMQVLVENGWTHL